MSALLLSAFLSAVPVNDPAHGFSFVLPDGYLRAPAESGSLHDYARGDPRTGSWAAFSVMPLGGTLEQDAVILHEVAEQAARKAAAAQGIELTGFEYRRAPWGPFELEVMLTRATAAGTLVSSLATQVPLAGGAVQLQLVGGTSDEALLVAELTGVVASLRGQSNWLSEAERSRELGRQVGFFVGVALVPLTGLLVLVYFILKKRKATRTAP